MTIEEARAIVSQALGVPHASAAYVMDHLDQLGLRLSRFRRTLKGPSVTLSVKRQDGREFTRESRSNEDTVYLAVADALLAPPVEEVIRTEAVLATGEEVILVVSRASGICPAKYAKGSSWVLAASDAVRPRLCKPAIAALEKMIRNLPARWSQGVFTCGCPARLGQVEFTLQRLPPSPQGGAEGAREALSVP